MESDWIFVYNTRPSLPNAGKVADIIQRKDGKPTSWYEIEVMLARYETNPKDFRQSMLITHGYHVNLLSNNLAGIIEFPESEPFLTQELHKLIPANNDTLPFSTLRAKIWQLTGNRFWPELQLRWSINQFVGRMFLLNHKMESIYMI